MPLPHGHEFVCDRGGQHMHTLLLGTSFGSDVMCCSCVQVPVLRPMDLMVEATPRRVFANAHTYHINSISVNSDYETYMSADDLRINLWNFEITNQSFSILSWGPRTSWPKSRVLRYEQAWGGVDPEGAVTAGDLVLVETCSF